MSVPEEGRQPSESSEDVNGTLVSPEKRGTLRKPNIAPLTELGGDDEDDDFFIDADEYNGIEGFGDLDDILEGFGADSNNTELFSTIRSRLKSNAVRDSTGSSPSKSRSGRSRSMSGALARSKLKAAVRRVTIVSKIGHPSSTNARRRHLFSAGACSTSSLSWRIRATAAREAVLSAARLQLMLSQRLGRLRRVRGPWLVRTRAGDDIYRHSGAW